MRLRDTPYSPPLLISLHCSQGAKRHITSCTSSWQRRDAFLHGPIFCRPSGHRLGGFTLLEVLIAIVVLSIGLLGLAGLQAAGLRNNNSAYMRTIATQQVHDIADRMRANPSGVRAGDYDNITNVIPADPGCLVAGCSPSQMATYDAFNWNTMNSNLLPLGTGTVTRIPNPLGVDPATNRFTITIAWDDNRMGAVNATFSMDLEI